MDYHLRPKLAYYAIKRELASLTIGLKRTTTTIFPPDNKYSRIPLETTHKIALWATNLSIQTRSVNVSIKAFDVISGAEIYHATVGENIFLPANRTIEVTEFDVPVRETDHQCKGTHMKTVVAAYVHDPSSGNQLARYVNWPDPLKYVPLQRPKQLRIRIVPDTGGIEVSAEVPVKGVTLESVDEKKDRLVWADNCVDVVPGETVVLRAKGLVVGEEDKVKVRYLGL